MIPKISILSALLPITLFLLFCFKCNKRGLWVIFLYTVLSFLFDVFLVSSPWALENRYLVWNIFAILEYCMLSYFYYLIINNRLIKLIIVIFSAVYLIAFFLLVSSSDERFNSILSALSSVFMLFLSLTFFVVTMKSSQEPVNLFSPIFLIVIALLLYVASTLFLYIIANRLTTKEMEQYWSINHVSNILTNIIFAAAFLLFRFQKNNPIPERTTVDFTRIPDDR